MADVRRFGAMDKVPTWADWLVAIVIGILLLNVNITSAGDALSGPRGVEDASAPGISETTRTVFYATVAVAGCVLAAGALVAGVLIAGFLRHAALAFRSFGFLAASGLAGLLLDYTDGPTRTVELVAYVALALATLRFVRLGLAATALQRADHAPAPIRPAA